MSRVITPVELEVLLHYHYSSTPLDDSSYSVRGAIERLVHQNLITKVRVDKVDSRSEGKEYTYTTTDRGNVYVEGLCSLPLPVQTWTMPKR